MADFSVISDVSNEVLKVLRVFSWACICMTFRSCGNISSRI